MAPCAPVHEFNSFYSTEGNTKDYPFIIEYNFEDPDATSVTKMIFTFLVYLVLVGALHCNASRLRIGQQE